MPKLNNKVTFQDYLDDDIFEPGRTEVPDLFYKAFTYCDYH